MATPWVFFNDYKAPNNDALQTTIGLLESHARFDGKTLNVNLRTAWDEGALYYDLCDSEWRAIKIDADGWELVDKPAVKFTRFSHMAEQVEPTASGNIDELFDFINVLSDTSASLLSIGWRLVSFPTYRGRVSRSMVIKAAVRLRQRVSCGRSI